MLRPPGEISKESARNAGTVLAHVPGVVMPRLATPRRRTWPSLVLRALAFVTALVTPAFGLAAWLLFADPALASDVVVSRDMMPLVQAMVDALTTVLERTLALL